MRQKKGGIPLGGYREFCYLLIRKRIGACAAVPLAKEFPAGNTATVACSRGLRVRRLTSTYNWLQRSLAAANARGLSRVASGGGSGASSVTEIVTVECHEARLN